MELDTEQIIQKKKGLTVSNYHDMNTFSLTLSCTEMSLYLFFYYYYRWQFLVRMKTNGILIVHRDEFVL